MTLRHCLLPAASALFVAVAGVVHAQNSIPNGDFQNTVSADDLWDGVDGDGYLCGRGRTVTALNERDSVAEIAQPVSVAVGDLNGDDLPDLLVADPRGYFTVYFNSGTKTAPKFTHGEVLPVYVSRPTPTPGLNRFEYLTAMPDMLYAAPRIDLYPLSGRGVLDIVVGAYGGDLLVLKNSGGPKTPVFRQPPNLQSILLQTSAKGQRWANLLAPTVYDWNNDKQPDILVGDGSYSANSIFLLQNPGASGGFRFTEDTRSYLVYGNGRNQLCPTIADYNGDGLPDVIVADSTGQVTVNLNDGKWKPGRVLEKFSVIRFGNTDSLHGNVTVKAADLNGDGLFDLVFGKTNGRIAIAFNKGTKEQPQFGVPEEIKGEDIWKRTLKIPNNWTIDSGLHKGNFYGVASVVSAADDPNAQPPDGKNCLKLYYDQPLNKVVPMAPIRTQPESPGIDLTFDRVHGNHPVGADLIGASTAVSSYTCQIALTNVVPDQPYQLSFQVKGANFSASYVVGMAAVGQLAPTKITHGERGSASVQSNNIGDVDTQDGAFGSSTNWTAITKSVTFHFHRQELNDPKKWKGTGAIRYTGTLVLKVDIAPFNGVCYLDNFQLVPKK
ncbi:MAG: VCBS repeat-containing protein [Chthoniobacteraceae bacterium]